MKRILLFLILVPTYVVAQNHNGYWTGTIELPNNTSLVIAVDLIYKEHNWTGTIDIPAQGLRDFTLSEFEIIDQRIQFEMSGIPGEPSFNGNLGDSGESIKGTFHQAGQSFPFSLQRAPRDSDEEVGPIKGIPGKGAEGKWKSTLEVGPTNLRLILNVSKTKDGKLKAILDSVDQGVKIPIDTIALKEKKVDFKIDSIRAAFVGILNEDGSAVKGNWQQSGQQFPLTFFRIGKTSK
jgi:hypothetical protein